MDIMNFPAIMRKVVCPSMIAGCFLVNTLSGMAQKSDNSPRESLFGETHSLANSHFSWGLDVGASIDLTAHDI